MNLESLKDIPSNFALAKRALVFCFVISIVTISGTFIWAYVTTNNIKNTAFVLTDEGKAALMKVVPISEIDTYRKPEIMNHIKMFHKAFWEIDQFNYERSVDKALNLSGSSGKRLFQTLLASGHFAKLATENLFQKLEIDSIKVDDQVTPYKAQFYGKLRVMRTDQKAESINAFKANFVLYNVSRTNKNPHGLLIENYHLESKEINTPK